MHSLKASYILNTHIVGNLGVVEVLVAAEADVMQQVVQL